MNTNIENIKHIYRDNGDFILRDFKLKNRSNLYICYFESLCNGNAIYDYVVKNILNSILFNKKINSLKEIISSPKLIIINDSEEAFYYLENGFVVIFYRDEILAVEVKAELDRGITVSQTEPSMYGPKDSFCENIQKNLGVLKRRIKTKDLKVESVDRGVYTKDRINLIYIDSLVDKKKVLNIKEKLNSHRYKEVLDSFDLSSELDQNIVFPTIFKTEKPGLASKYLLKGYVIIMIDNTPFVLIMDAKFKDFVNPFTSDKFVKVLRYICLFLTILTPAIYIALINFNPETIPIKLLINFAEQRASVPFPAVVEALIMLLVCEILREADIRFPNSYGSAASILGALVLGEAAVSAGIVSAIMIIIIAITFITNLIFTEIKLVWSIRILRIAFLLISSFLGLYGLSIAFIAVINILANTKMYEGEYL